MKKSQTYKDISQYVPGEFMDFTIESYRILRIMIRKMLKLSKPHVSALYEKAYLHFKNDYEKLQYHIKKHGLKKWTVSFNTRTYDRDRDEFIFYDEATKTRITVHPKMPDDFIMNEIASLEFDGIHRYDRCRHMPLIRWFNNYIKENIEEVLDKAGV